MTAHSSLIAFHRVLITAGIIFCVGFAIWIWSADHAVVAVVFVLLALGLSYYLKNLSRFLDYTEDR